MKGISPRNDTRRGIANLWRREVGSISPRNFADSIRASEGIFRCLGIERKLKEHRGCVNTLCFNTDGSILLSGSDDGKIILWDWQVGSSKFSLHTGHTENILNSQFMPWSNDSSIITCSADGQVRHVNLSDGATVRVLAKQLGVVHKMAIEPGSANTFYACSEFGLVTHFDLRTNEHTSLFSIIDSSAFIVELYDIAIDPTNPYLSAVAGSEEVVRIYDFRKWGSSNTTPSNSMVGSVSPTQWSSSNVDGITGLAYSNTGELLVSYSRNDIYLFPREQVSGFDESARSELKVYRGHINKKTVKGVYFLGPSCEYVASGSDSGHAFIWRKRDGEILRALKGDRFVVNCIEPHPLVSVLATSGIDKDVKVWAPQSFEREHSKKEVEMAAETMDGASSSDDEYSEVGSLYDEDDNYDEDSEVGSLYDEDDNYDEDSDGHDDDDDDYDDDDDDDVDDHGGGGGGGKGGFISEDEMQ